MKKIVTKLGVLLSIITIVVACSKAKDAAQPGFDPFNAPQATYPTGPLTANYNGQSWIMSSGEARVVDGMDQSKLLEVILWPENRTACANPKPPVSGKEIHLLIPVANGETHIKAINPDGSMVTFLYVNGSKIGSDYTSDAHVLIESIDGGIVKGKATGKSMENYSLGGEFSVPLCP